MSERYYSGIESVKELTNTEDVNKHLATKEWELLAIKEKENSKLDGHEILERNIEVVYIIGYKKKATATWQEKQWIQHQPAGASVTSTVQPQPKPPQLYGEDVERLPWRDSKYGTWVFAEPSRYKEDLDEGQTNTILNLLRLIGPDNKEYQFEDYVYKLSGDKNDFITRRLIKK